MDFDALVVDNGTSSIRVGIAGNEVPKIRRTPIFNPGGDDSDISSAKFPLTLLGERDVDLETLIEIYKQIFQEFRNHESKFLFFSEFDPFTFSEPEKFFDLVFETFDKSPGIYISSPELLSLYSSGRTTGVVCNSGFSKTTVVGVLEGSISSKFAGGFERIKGVSGVYKNRLGGKLMTDFFCHSIFNRPLPIFGTKEFKEMEKFKEEVCYIKTSKETKSEIFQYTLPDKTEILVNGEKRYQVLESLFNPKLLGYDDKKIKGLHVLIDEIAHKRASFQEVVDDYLLPKKMYENILLTGGNTLFNGFSDRLYDEIQNLISRSLNPRIISPAERLDGAWIGGSILASLSTFESMWVSRSQWEDEGSQRFMSHYFEKTCIWNKKIVNKRENHMITTLSNFDFKDRKRAFLDYDMKERVDFLLFDVVDGIKVKEEGSGKEVFRKRRIRLDIGNCQSFSLNIVFLLL